MRKFLRISGLAGVLGGALGGLGGCAALLTPPPPAPAIPATPIFFQSFSANLDAPALTAIAAAARQAQADPAAPITVVGAADTIGSAKANRLLSETRAQVVADALESDGIPAARIRTQGLGETTTPGSTLPTQFSRRALIRIGG